MRRVSFNPPATPNFSIGSLNYPEANKGDIAPGMSVTVMIHFHAEAASEFDD